MNILVINAGSSSLKSRLYSCSGRDFPEEAIEPLWTGEINWKSNGAMAWQVKTADGRSASGHRSTTNRTNDILDLLNLLWTDATQVIDQILDIDIVGHRVVHGGDRYRQPTLVDGEVQAEIDRLSIFAPLHNPINLMGIQIIESLAPTLPQIAVFDTAFYGDLPAISYVYPLPYEWLERGIRKYGFHGISHQYCADRAAQLLGQELKDLRLISCHLGNGCSLAAIKNGHCIDTTMGFTPLDGLMMGSRCGSIDPGIILHVLREKMYTVEELDHILNSESGLLGVSGVSNDLREIDRAIALDNDRAQLALGLYVHILCSKISSLLPQLGGVDALIFTAGVGENHQGIRQAVAEKLAFLGVEIDPALNSLPISPDRDLSTPQSLVKLLGIHTQEEWQIAKNCWKFAALNGFASNNSKSSISDEESSAVAQLRVS
jgi:acetate kinase